MIMPKHLYPRACSVSGCDGDSRSSARGRKGFCRVHYGRWRRHGDPTKGQISKGAPMEWLLTVAATFEGDECLLWPFSVGSGGYGRAVSNGVVYDGHRWVCEKFHGPSPSSKHEAAHGCGVRRCVNHRHLRWATTAENHADKLIHGTHTRGERHPTAKLSEESVRKILDRAAAGDLQAEIADDFNISRSHVGSIITGKRWGWLHTPARAALEATR